MSRNPYLSFGEVEIQQEKDRLSGKESLDIVSHKFLADIDHLM